MHELDLPEKIEKKKNKKIQGPHLRGNTFTYDSIISAE